MLASTLVRGVDFLPQRIWRLPLAAARCGSSYQSSGPPMLRGLYPAWHHAARTDDQRCEILDAVSLDLHHLRAARIGQKHVAVGNDRRQRYQAPGRVRLFAKIGGRLGGWGAGGTAAAPARSLTVLLVDLMTDHMTWVSCFPRHRCHVLVSQMSCYPRHKSDNMSSLSDKMSPFPASLLVSAATLIW